MTEKYLKKFMRFHRARIFGFTATPDGRSDHGERFGEAIFGPEIRNVGYQEAVVGGNIVQIKARIYTSDKGPNVTGMSNDVAANRLAIWRNEDRNALIAAIAGQMREEYDDGAQILIMVDKTEHAFRLGQLLPDYSIVTGKVDPTTETRWRRNGTIAPDQEVCTPRMRREYKDAFESCELRYAISTRVWSKGVDFRDLEVLIRADGTASPIDSGQVPGRLSRLGDRINKEHGVLVDLYDTFSRNLEYRSRKRIAVYRQNGYEITMIRGNDVPV